jgi:hypothetical protein
VSWLQYESDDDDIILPKSLFVKRRSQPTEETRPGRPSEPVRACAELAEGMPSAPRVVARAGPPGLVHDRARSVSIAPGRPAQDPDVVRVSLALSARRTRTTRQLPEAGPPWASAPPPPGPAVPVRTNCLCRELLGVRRGGIGAC